MRYCPNCGTEVDETAVFCPTCGQPIDQAAEAEMPAAPAWPESPTAASPPSGAVAADAARTADHERVPEAPPPVATERPAAAPPPAAAVPPEPSATAPPSAAPDERGPMVEVPVTLPVTLSGWLIGGGALLAALGVLIGLFDGPLNLIQVLLLVALIGVAVVVFFSDRVPGGSNLRVATLVVPLIGFGIALDRLGTGGAGVGELLLFLGTAAAAMGAILVELGRDQPLGLAR